MLIVDYQLTLCISAKVFDKVHPLDIITTLDLRCIPLVEPPARLNVSTVSIFRRTLLGYYAEGMHANFKYNLI